MTESFGTTKKGEKCQLFRLRNQKGMEAHITDYGATVVRLYVPDREGDLVDVVLGYEDAAGYEKVPSPLGAWWAVWQTGSEKAGLS